MKAPHQPEQIRRLADICHIVFDADVFEKCRERRFVDARITFSMLLHEQGLGCSEVGRILRRNHATILHYFTRGEELLEVDEKFRKRFVMAREEYAGEDPVYYYTAPDLRKKFMELRNDYEYLQRRIKEMKDDAKSDKRFEEIFNVIRYRTKRGKEEEALIRINRLYNGL